MNNRTRAFTLIELLVVIAIIAILAAILFPVFAQAKAAAKQTTAISNVKQIGISQQIYLADFDDTLPQRRFCESVTPRIYVSWKQVTEPYSKNAQLYTDPMNIAAKYLDDTSDPVLAAAMGTQITTKYKAYARGYAMNNIAFYLNGAWDLFGPCDQDSAGFYQNTIVATAIDEPASVAALFEHKYAWVDTGSYLSWEKPFTDPDGVQRVGGWSFGGSKWSEKAMALVYMDSHSKRTAHSAICATKPDQYTPWGWRFADLTNHAPGGDMSWMATYCDTMPADVK